MADNKNITSDGIIQELLASTGYLFPSTNNQVECFESLYPISENEHSSSINPDKIIEANKNVRTFRTNVLHQGSLHKVTSISNRPKRKWQHESIIRLMEENEDRDAEYIIRKKARNLVLDALEKGWSGPPFNSIELARLMGMNITPNDSVADACITSDVSNQFLIEYNPFQKPTRVNFSVAHEIVHTFFSDCSNAIRNREEKPTENRELEQLCNLGASELQLPYAVFSNDANGLEKITLESLVDLATKYKASLESLFIRFTEVVDDACAILICSLQESGQFTIDYSKKSKYFRNDIPPFFSIPKDSKAFDCTLPGFSARETISWPFLDGYHDVYYVGISPVRRDNRPRVGILVVPNNGTEFLQNRGIEFETGDATKPTGTGTKIIAQVVNTSGALGFGFGKSLSKNFPEVKDELAKWKQDKSSFQLGKTRLIPVKRGLYIFQMLAQQGLFEKNGEIPLKYKSLRECLVSLSELAQELEASVHMPLIGAGQAKGEWNVIQGMIHDELISNNVKVKIYLLRGSKPNPNLKSNLTFFNEKSTWRKEE